jgi:pimeloyl-ACP methyl ester carboxylesterase
MTVYMTIVIIWLSSYRELVCLNGQLPTMRLLTYPKAGHGPHHQYPEEAAKQIAAFIKTANA